MPLRQDKLRQAGFHPPPISNRDGRKFSPSILSSMIRLDNISKQHNTGLFGIVGVIVLVFGATGIFTEIQGSINYIWSIKAKPEKGWLKYLTDRLLSFSLIIGIGFLMLVTLFINILVDMLTKRLEIFIGNELINARARLSRVAELTVLFCCAVDGIEGAQRPVQLVLLQGRQDVTGDDKGLGIVDFSIFPHVDHPDLPENTMAAAEQWAAGLGNPAYAIDDATAIRVVDGAVDVISEGHWRHFTP